MCLSNVFKEGKENEEPLLKNVATVSQEGDELIFSDIMGIPYRVKGSIGKIDLLENIIIIKEEKGE